MILYMNQAQVEELILNRLLINTHKYAILDVQRKLQIGGYLCWVSGGAVRDAYLNRKFHDIDLTTNADESFILEQFPNAVLTGRQFGVYKIPYANSEGIIVIDLTVFREEDSYEDGRRPSQIIKSTPQKDAARRDFTINALFYDLNNNQTIDYVGGLDDLNRKVLKCVGHARDRFLEDHLRILRLVRFKAQLDFSIESETLAAALNTAHLLVKISAERKTEELKRIFESRPEESFWKDMPVKTIVSNLQLPVRCLNSNTFNQIDAYELWVASYFKKQIRQDLIFVLYYDYIGGFNSFTESESFFLSQIRLTKAQNGFLRKLWKVREIVSNTIRSAVDMVLDVESEIKKGHFESDLIYYYLSYLGLIDSQIFEKFKNLWSEKRPVLVETSDILQHGISGVDVQIYINKARRLQYEQNICDRKVLVDLLFGEN